MSTLSRKNDIAKKMSGEASEEAMIMQQEQMRLQMSSLARQVEKLEAETKVKEAETMAKAAEVAQILATTPAIAPVLDKMLSQIKNEATENEKSRSEESEGVPSQEGRQEGPYGPQERQEMLNPSLGML